MWQVIFLALRQIRHVKLKACLRQRGLVFIIQVNMLSAEDIIARLFQIAIFFCLLSLDRQSAKVPIYHSARSQFKRLSYRRLAVAMEDLVVNAGGSIKTIEGYLHNVGDCTGVYDASRGAEQ